MLAVAGETVAASGCTLDAVFPDELLDRGANGCMPGRGAFADLALRERRFGFGEGLDDALFGGFGFRHGLGRPCPAEARAGCCEAVSKLPATGRSLDAVEAWTQWNVDGGGSRYRFPLQLPGIAGTGNREPRGIRSLVTVDVVV